MKSVQSTNPLSESEITFVKLFLAVVASCKLHADFDKYIYTSRRFHWLLDEEKSAAKSCQPIGSKKIRSAY
jgi:hypothetical protein